MTKNDMQKQVDDLGSLNEQIKLLEKHRDSLKGILLEQVLLRDQSQVTGEFFKAILVHSNSTKWNKIAIERLAKRNNYKMSRLRSIEPFDYIRVQPISSIESI